MAAKFNDITMAKESLNRCLAQERFLDRFYDLFLASSEEVREKLKHLRREHQLIMLKMSMHVMFAMAAGGMQDSDAMSKLAALHSRRDKDIRPELYDLWLDCMLQTVREFDPKFDTALEQAWRAALAPGIAYMIEHY